jgi:hypothetical protein
MMGKILAPVLALLVLAWLVQGAQAADARADLEPYYTEPPAVGGQQWWYLANTNLEHRIRAVVAERNNGTRIRDVVLTIDPNNSAFVGVRNTNDRREWVIVSAHYIRRR